MYTFLDSLIYSKNLQTNPPPKILKYSAIFAANAPLTLCYKKNGALPRRVIQRPKYDLKMVSKTALAPSKINDLVW